MNIQAANPGRYSPSARHLVKGAYTMRVQSLKFPNVYGVSSASLALGLEQTAE